MTHHHRFFSSFSSGYTANAIIHNVFDTNKSAQQQQQQQQQWHKEKKHTQKLNAKNGKNNKFQFDHCFGIQKHYSGFMFDKFDEFSGKSLFT